MDPFITFKLLLLILLFVLSALFAASEAAFFSLTSLHLHKIREERAGSFGAIQKLLSFPRRLLITIIISNEAVNVILSTLMGALFIQVIGNHGKWVAIVAMTPLMLIFCEAIPKTLAKTNPIKLAVISAPVLSLSARLEAPVITTIDRLSGWLTKPLKQPGKESRTALMEREFRTLIDIGHRQGVLDKPQRDLIHRIFDLGDTEAADIMTPRVDIFCLPASLSMGAMREALIRHGFSRVPVYGESRDEIVGILYAKDLLGSVSGHDEIRDVRAILRKPYYVPMEKKADRLLREFQSRKIHLALVVDEYGGLAGLATMEDVLENIFGDIYDERDIREIDYHLLADKTLIVKGRMPVEKFNELTAAAIPTENFDTVGGYVFHLFGRLPLRGEEITDGDFRFRVERMGKARILRIRIERLRKSDG